MANSVPDGYIEVRAGVYERPRPKPSNVKNEVKKPTNAGLQKAVLPNEGQGGDTKPKRTLRNDTLAKAVSKKENSGRVHIVITQRRKRRIDPDNVINKWHIDCLRYAGVLSDDGEKDVTVSFKQEKGPVEETIIELFDYEPTPIRHGSPDKP